MNKIIALVTVFFCTQSMAQIKQAIITYEKKQNMHRRINNEQFKANIPEFRISNYTLSFNDSVSLFKYVPEEESLENADGNGGGFNMRSMMRMGTEIVELFRNRNSKLQVEKVDFGARNFLVRDSIKKIAWKIVPSETKVILGHKCYKATTKLPPTGLMVSFLNMRRNNRESRPDRDSLAQRNPEDSSRRRRWDNTVKDNEIEAWFAEDMPTPVGPEYCSGLPGTILMMDFNKGEIVFSAQAIKETVTADDLKPSTKGKKVTKQEFDEIVKEMMENFRQQGGGYRIRMQGGGGF